MLDAVILAGGKSERLTGIVPPYHKPFLVVNGTALIVAAVKHAQSVGAKRIVVVATGENALPIWQLVGQLEGVHVVLNDAGVGQAVYTGLKLCTQERVLVLMSDNVHGADDITAVCRERYSIGVREVPVDEARRFTRYVDARWVEGPDAPVPNTQYVTIWCGPLVIDRMCSLATLVDKANIGPHLDMLSPQMYDAQLVLVSSFDVGIPSAVAAITQINGEVNAI